MVKDRVPFSEAAKRVVGAVPSGQSYAAVVASGATTSAVQTASARVVSQSRGSQAMRSVSTQTEQTVISVGVQTVLTGIELFREHKTEWITYMGKFGEDETVPSYDENYYDDCEAEIEFLRGDQGDEINEASSDESMEEDEITQSYQLSPFDLNKLYVNPGDRVLMDEASNVEKSSPSAVTQYDKLSPSDPSKLNSPIKTDKMSLQDLSKLDAHIKPGDRVLIGRGRQVEKSDSSVGVRHRLAISPVKPP
jgi:hypothetical protein